MKILLKKLALLILIIFALDMSISFVMKNGVNDFYGIDTPSKAVFIGHSRMDAAIDDDLISKMTGSSFGKYAAHGTEIYEHKLMIDHYIGLYENDVKTVILNIDKRYLSRTSLGENSYTQFFPYIDNDIWKEYLFSSSKKWSEYYSKLVFSSLRFTEVRGKVVRGYMNKKRTLNNRIKLVSPEKYVNDSTFSDIDPEKVKTLELIIKKTKEDGKNILLLETPVFSLSEQAEKHKAIIRGLADKYKVEYIDLSSNYKNVPGFYNDGAHFNEDGKRAFSTELAGTLIELIDWRSMGRW